MLNGIAPVLIFTFKPLSFSRAASTVAGIPLIGSTLSDVVGIPIPIYMDEKLTGIFIESESKAIDIATKVQVRYDGKPSVEQQALNSIVTINMLASKSSILLSVLLAMCDQIFSKVVAQNYSIHYLNGPTTIFGGLLHGFSTQAGSDDDLLRIVMQISKGKQETPTPGSVVSVLPKITGATPVAVPL